MVETAQPPATETQAPVATTTAAEKKANAQGLKKLHAEYLARQKAYNQEIVKKFKRSNDAVLYVFTPEDYSDKGCISCAADHGV